LVSGRYWIETLKVRVVTIFGDDPDAVRVNVTAPRLLTPRPDNTPMVSAVSIASKTRSRRRLKKENGTINSPSAAYGKLNSLSGLAVA
jgi:hypothetical protein